MTVARISPSGRHRGRRAVAGALLAASLTALGCGGHDEPAAKPQLDTIVAKDASQTAFTNVALNKQTYAYPGNVSASALAVDGVTANGLQFDPNPGGTVTPYVNTGAFRTNASSPVFTITSANAYWEVDLGATQPLAEVEIWGHTDPNLFGGANHDFVVLLSNAQLGKNVPAATLQSDPSVVFSTKIVGAQQMPVQTIPVNASGRWLRIQLSGATAGALYLAEVRALTSAAGTTPAPIADNQSCAPASSTASPAQCVGPWQYHTQQEPCSEPHADRSSSYCGQEQDLSNPIYPSCNWCAAGTSASQGWKYVPYTTITVCVNRNPKGYCLSNGPQYTASESCAQFANDQLTSDRSANPSCYAATSVTNVSGPASGFSSTNLADMKCAFTFLNAPTWTYSPKPVCGAPTYNMINKVCDLEEYDQCGDNPGVSYSATGLSVADLQTLYPAQSATYVSNTPLPAIESQAEIFDSSITPPSCTTCDDIVVQPRAQDANGTHVLDKAQCLAKQSWTGLDGTTTAQVYAANAINAKLLLETHADQLASQAKAAGDTTTMPALEAFYVLDPSVSPTPACGAAPWTVPSQPACVTAYGSAAWTKVNTDMALCARMSGSAAFPIDPAVQQYYALRCMKTLPDELKVLATTAGCDASGFEKRYESFMPTWLGGMLGASSGLSFSPGSDTNSNVSAIESELAYAEDWYDDQLALQGLTAGLSADVSGVTQAFWNGILPNGGYGSLSPTDPTALVSATKTQIEAYREVLYSLFDDNVQQPLEAELFVQLFSQAIEPIWMRLDDTVLYHDLGCRFADCVNTNRASELTDMWALLSVMLSASDSNPNNDSLANEVARFTSATNPSLVSAEWQKVFSAMLKNHQRLETAISALNGGAPYSASAVLATPLSQLPASLLTLRKVVVDAGVKTASYNKTGSLGGALTNVLHTGIQKSQVKTISSVITNITSPLDADISSWQTDMPLLIADVLAQGNIKADQTSVRDKLAQMNADFNTYDGQITALRMNTTVDDEHFGDFLTGWNSLISGPAVADGVTTRAYQPTTITPADALMPKGGQITSQATLSQYAVAVHSGDLDKGPNGEIAIPVHEGDTIQVSTGDSWSPNCAFAQYTFPTPQFAPGTKPALTPDLVGTDGYMLTVANSAFQAVGQTKANGTTSTDSTTSNNCMTWTISSTTPAYISAITTMSLTSSTSSQNCLDWSHSSSNSTTNTTQNNTQDSESANFATGLRISIDPFPEFPTGALLMVQVPSAPNRPWRTQVVHNGNEGMIADADGTVYLLVNDVNGGACTVSPEQGTLKVNITKSQGLTGLAKTLGPLMAKELQLFRDGVDENGNARNGLDHFVAAGAFTADDRTSLNDQALDDLRLAIAPQTLASMPAEVMSYYQTRVDYELNRIDRAVQINALQIKQQQLVLQMQQLWDQLSSDSGQSALAQLNSSWEASLLDQSKLRQDTENAANFMMTYIYPIFAVRYPDLLGVNGWGFYTKTANNQTVPVQAIADLLDVSWQDELYTQALKVQAAKNLIVNYFNLEDAAAPPVDAHPVILSVPRPEALAACAGNPFCTLSGYPRISPDRAAQFWKDFDSSGKASFKIMPEDLYIPGGSDSLLTCGEVSPVIESMQLAFNIGDGGTTYSTLNVADMHASGDMLFPTSTGMQQFIMDNNDWLGTQVGLIFSGPAGLENAVLSYMANQQIHAGFGEGLSPFETFAVNMSNFVGVPSPPDNWPQISSLEEMLVVFELEYSSGDTSYMTACGGGTAAH